MATIGFLFATGGLTALTIALTMLYKHLAFYRYSIVTVGKIVGIEYVDAGRRRRGHAAVIEFIVSPREKLSRRRRKFAAPVLIRFQASELKSETAHQIGAEVSVRYVPQKPELAKIDSFAEIWLEPLTGVLVGLAFMTVGLFFMRKI